MTKHRRRDKESVAQSHRNKIAGARIAGTRVAETRSSAVVVNLARLRPGRQSRPEVWIPARSSWLSDMVVRPALILVSRKTVIHALYALW